MKNGDLLTVDDYINHQPAEVQKVLQRVREIVKKAAPKAEEVISYGMPAIKQHSVLVYYAAAKNHYGFYPTSKPIVVFKERLAEYKTSKGAIQLPYDKPVPVKLITDIVKYRLKEDNEKAALKKKK